jgi:hypothetical protein
MQSPNSRHEGTAKPTSYAELPAAFCGVIVWLYLTLAQGLRQGLYGLPFLLLGVLLGGWTLFMRLHFSPSRVGLTIGPWRRYVELSSLRAVYYKRTGGWRTRGTLFLRDSAGHTVPIYWGRFDRGKEWGPLILSAARGSGAAIDSNARRRLETISGKVEGGA